MSATSVSPLNQMTQERDQDALIWGAEGVTMETIIMVEKAVIKVTTNTVEGTVGASEGSGVVNRVVFCPGKMDSRGGHRQDCRERP